jgi:hypothetical protein
VLTLTGETKRADVEAAADADQPDVIIADLDEFARLLETRRS